MVPANRKQYMPQTPSELDFLLVLSFYERWRVTSYNEDFWELIHWQSLPDVAESIP